MRVPGVYLLFCGFNTGFSKVYGRVCAFRVYARNTRRARDGRRDGRPHTARALDDADARRRRETTTTTTTARRRARTTR